MSTLERLVGWTVTSIFVAFVCLTFLQVVLRYLFSNSLGWIDEFCRFGFIWMVALGGAIRARHGTHMAITVLEEAIGARYRKVLLVFGDLGLIAFAALLGIGGWQLMQLNLTSMSPALQIPIAWVQTILPIFGALTAAFAFEHAVRLVFGTSGEEQEAGDG